MTAISSMASSTGFGAGFETGELDAAGKFDPLVDRNLEYHENPQVVALPQFGLARVLFSARRIPKSSSGGSIDTSYKRFVFISDVDLTVRGGAAKFLTNEVPVSGNIRKAANSESLSVRTFGVSDGGRFLLLGQSDGYRLVDSQTLASHGVLKVGAAGSFVNPSLRESDMMLSVSESDGTSFTTKLYSVGLNSGGGLKSLSLVATVPSIRRPLVSIGDKAAESYAALDTSNRILIVSPLKPLSATKSVIAKIPAKGRLASSVAFWRDSGTKGVRAAIVFEHFVAESGGMFSRYKIEQVFIRTLKVDESKLSADATNSDFDYPSESRQTVESGIGAGSSMFLGVKDFRASSDGLAVFGLFPGSLSSQLYRLTATGLERVSQESCTGFSIGREL